MTKARPRRAGLNPCTLGSQCQPAFEVAHLAAGGSQVKDASGGPAGGQTFEKFDKQDLKNNLG